MKTLLLLSLSSLSFLFINAQKVQTLPAEKDWVIKSVASNAKEWFFGTDDVFDKDILYLNDSEVVFPVRYDNKASGLVKMNKDGKVVWTLNFTSAVLGIGKQKNGVIVFLWTDVGISATIVDVFTGKNGREQGVYSTTKKEGAHPIVLNDAAGNFKSLVLRIDATHGERFPETSDRNAITKLMTITADEQLNLNGKELKLVGAGNTFVGVAVNDEGELFVCSQNEGQIFVEQFSAQGNQLNKLTTSFSLKKKGSYISAMTIDPQNKKAVLLGMHYESDKKSSKNIFYTCDFTAKKVIASNEEELDKDFARSLHAVKEHRGPAGRLGSIEDLQIVDILPIADKIIVIKEMRSAGNPTSSVIDLFHEYVVVSFYDRSWKLLGNVAYDKMLQTSSSGRSLGYWMDNGKLYIVANALSSILADYATLLLTIDVNSMQLQKISVLDKSGLEARSFIEAGGTIRFGNVLYLQNMIPQKAHYNTRFMHTVLQRVDL
jgi:hypothetical protein